MTRFAWQDDYSVRDAELDAQHQQLLAIMNELADEIGHGDALRREVADHLFGELARYVMSHFAFEEQRMIESHVPAEAVLTHRQAHNELIRQLQTLQAEVERGESSLADVLPFLYGDWLISHICTIDQEYVPYLQSATRSAD